MAQMPCWVAPHHQSHLGDWLTGAKKKEGPSPPTAIWAIGLGGEKRPLHQSPLSDWLRGNNWKKEKVKKRKGQ